MRNLSEVDRVVAVMRGTLPVLAQIELDNILADAARRHIEIDKIAIATEVFKQNIVRVEPLPERLKTVEQGSGGRWFELLIHDGVNYCDAAVMNGLRAQYFRECETVKAMATTGLTYEAAWAQIRAEVGPFDDDTPAYAHQGANGSRHPVARHTHKRKRKRAAAKLE